MHTIKFKVKSGRVYKTFSLSFSDSLGKEEFRAIRDTEVKALTSDIAKFLSEIATAAFYAANIDD